MPRPNAPLPHRLRLSQGSRHPPASPRRSTRNRQSTNRHYPPPLRRSPSHDLAPPPPKTLTHLPDHLSGKRKTAPHRGAGHDFVPEERHGNASRSAQGPCRAPSGSAFSRGSPGYEAGRRRAIGVVAAFPSYPRATTSMVRRWAAGTASQRTRRPGMRAGSGTVAFISGNAPPTRSSQRVLRECPLKRCLGPKRATFGEAPHSKIGLRRHVRSRPTPRTLQANIPRSFEAWGRRWVARTSSNAPTPTHAPNRPLVRLETKSSSGAGTETVTVAVAAAVAATASRHHRRQPGWLSLHHP